MVKWEKAEREKVIRDLLSFGTGVWKELDGWGKHVPCSEWPSKKEFEKAFYKEED